MANDIRNVTDCKFTRTDKGFLQINGRQSCLGGILFIRVEDKVILVKKQSKDGYEFSSMQALPGGMCRTKFGSGVNKIYWNSLLSRLHEETALRNNEIINLNLIKMENYITTAYTVKGVKKYTLVIPAKCDLVSRPKNLTSSHTSVVSANWVNINCINWEKISPLNRIIIYNLVHSELSPFIRQRAETATEKAKIICKKWEQESII